MEDLRLSVDKKFDSVWKKYIPLKPSSSAFMTPSSVTFMPSGAILQSETFYKQKQILQVMQSPSLNQPRRWKSLERGAESAVRDEVWRGSLPWSLAILSEDSA